MNILVCDDDRAIVDAIEIYLSQEGYTVVKAYDGLDALKKLQENEIQLVLMDVMMPGMDGIRTTMKIRETSSVPIIFLSAKSEDVDKILGLNIGADDYIVKPFSPGEVMARIRAILRRMSNYSDLAAHQILSIDNLRIDLSSYSVTVNGEPLGLAKKAIEILWTLASKPHRTFTRETLLEQLWGEEYHGDIRAVDSQVKRMRLVLSQQPHPNWDIKTVWGVGPLAS